MTITLADIKRNTMGPPRIVIYGVEGVGKTTLAACAEDAVWIPVEDGLAGLDVPAFPQPESYEQLLEMIDALVRAEKPPTTLVVDSLTRVEKLLVDYVVRTVPDEKGRVVKSIEGYGFYKGQKTHQPNELSNLLAGFDACRARGMQIILIAHASTVRYDDPSTDPYDRYQVAIEKYSEPVLYGWADLVAFMNYKVAVVDREGSDKRRGAGSGEVCIYTVARPSHRAKNRYRMPFEIKVPVDHPEVAWAVIQDHIKRADKPIAIATVPAS